MNMFFLIMLILSITPTEQLYAPVVDHIALDDFGDHDVDDPARPTTQDPTHHTYRDNPLDPTTGTASHRTTDPKTVRQDPTQPKPQPISVVARDGGDTTVTDPAKVKAVLAGLDGSIPGTSHSSTTQDPKTALENFLDKLQDQIKSAKTESSDVAFDNFSKNLIDSTDPETTLKSYSKKIFDLLLNLKSIKKSILDNSSTFNPKTLLKECNDMNAVLESTYEKIKAIKSRVAKKLSEKPYDALANLKKNMKNPNFKFTAQHLTELTTLFNDSFSYEPTDQQKRIDQNLYNDPKMNTYVSAYLRADIANTLRTIKESNKNISKNERHSLKLVLDDIKLVTGFLNSLNSGRFTADEIKKQLESLIAKLLARSKKGYFGLAKQRKAFEIKLVAALTAYVNAKNAAETTTKDTNTTTQQLNARDKAEQATKGTTEQLSAPAKAKLKSMTTNNTPLLNAYVKGA